MLIVEPGTVLPRVLLLDVLREAHEAAQEVRQREIAERKKHGAPLDDATRWPAVVQLADDLKAAAGNTKTADVVRLAQAIHAAAAGNQIEPLADFEPDADLEGIGVRLILISDAERRDLLARLSDSFGKLAKAHAGEATHTEIRALSEGVALAQEAWVLACVDAIDGIESMEGPTTITDVAAAMPALRRAGLLDPLFSAARHIQDLTPGKAVRCGRRQQPRSGSSSAPDAHSTGGAFSAATVADSGTPGPPTSPIAVPADSYSITLTSLPRLASPALLETVGSE